MKDIEGTAYTLIAYSKALKCKVRLVIWKAPSPRGLANPQDLTEGVFSVVHAPKSLPRHRMAHNTAGEERRHGGQKTDRGGGQ